MNRDFEDIKAMLTAPESTDPETLKALAGQYPYFPLPDALLERYHRSELSEEESKAVRLHLAIATGDRKALYDLATEEGREFEGIYPPAPKAETVTTENALDTFFANYGTTNKAETDLLEKLIFNPVPDYAEILAQEDAEEPASESESDGMMSRIDAFLRDRAKVEGPQTDEPAESVPAQPQVEAVAEKPRITPLQTQPATDNSLLSESLAKIFIKQGRYERAYEIISNLSLNYPKKSIYFADQLRFLQKLIKIQQAKAQK